MRGGRERTPEPAAPRAEVERHIETASEPAPAAEHVLFAPTGEGYELVAAKAHLRLPASPSSFPSFEALLSWPAWVGRLAGRCTTVRVSRARD